MTIGKLGSPWTVDTARKEALRILAEAAAGRDAGAEKLERRARGTTFAEVAEQFRVVHGTRLKLRTREAYGTLIRLHLNPAFGKTPIGDISRAAIASFHAKHADTPRNANHALAVLSKIMSWAEEQGLRPLDSNPCRRIAKYHEAKRDRYLTPDELMRLGDVLAKAEEQDADPYVIAAIRLLLFTGARLSEILTPPLGLRRHPSAGPQSSGQQERRESHPLEPTRTWCA